MSQDSLLKPVVQDIKSYTDFSGLRTLRSAAKNNDPEAVKEVAKQFETYFWNLIIKTMNESGSVFESDLLSGSSTKMYEDMHGQQLATEMGKQGKLGLADMLVQQLSKYEASKKREGAEKVFSMDSVNRMDSPTVSSTNKKDPGFFESPESFIKTLKPYAEKAAEMLALDPRVLLSQAALETGWGKSIIHNDKGENSHNLFSIKSHRDWSGDSVNVKTHEFRDGQFVKENADFRKYDSYLKSFMDYVGFLKESPRYQKALENSENPEAFLKNLKEAGYATDPSYDKKILRILKSDHIQSFSEEK